VVAAGRVLATAAALVLAWAAFTAGPAMGALAANLPSRDELALRHFYAHALVDLARAPVALLPAPRATIAAEMTAMGLHRLAELRAQPRSGLARRFGEGLLDTLDRAFGDIADSRRWATLPAVFEARLELAARAENTEQVLHGAGVLLTRLVAWAQGRQVRVGRFVLRCLHERARQELVPPTELAVELAEPAIDLAHLQGLLKERLGRLELPAPTLDLQLHCHHVVAAPVVQPQPVLRQFGGDAGPRHQHHVAAGRRERAADIAADRAGAEHHDAAVHARSRRAWRRS
jgi:hypothetical protein